MQVVDVLRNNIKNNLPLILCSFQMYKVAIPLLITHARKMTKSNHFIIFQGLTIGKYISGIAFNKKNKREPCALLLFSIWNERHAPVVRDALINNWSIKRKWQKLEISMLFLQTLTITSINQSTFVIHVRLLKISPNAHSHFVYSLSNAFSSLRSNLGVPLNTKDESYILHMSERYQKPIYVVQCGKL